MDYMIAYYLHNGSKLFIGIIILYFQFPFVKIVMSHHLALTLHNIESDVHNSAIHTSEVISPCMKHIIR